MKGLPFLIMIYPLVSKINGENLKIATIIGRLPVLDQRDVNSEKKNTIIICDMPLYPPVEVELRSPA